MRYQELLCFNLNQVIAIMGLYLHAVRDMLHAFFRKYTLLPFQKLDFINFTRQ